jgi:hypothetical protein
LHNSTVLEGNNNGCHATLNSADWERARFSHVEVAHDGYRGAARRCLLHDDTDRQLRQYSGRSGLHHCHEYFVHIHGRGTDGDTVVTISLGPGRLAHHYVHGMQSSDSEAIGGLEADELQPFMYAIATTALIGKHGSV